MCKIIMTKLLPYTLYIARFNNKHNMLQKWQFSSNDKLYLNDRYRTHTHHKLFCDFEYLAFCCLNCQLVKINMHFPNKLCFQNLIIDEYHIIHVLNHIFLYCTVKFFPSTPLATELNIYFCRLQLSTLTYFSFFCKLLSIHKAIAA